MGTFAKKSIGGLLMAGGSALGTWTAWHRELNLWLRLVLMLLALAALFFGAKMIRDAEPQEQRRQLTEAVVRMKAKRIRKASKKPPPRGPLRMFGRP